MKASKMLISTLKEAPNEAKIDSHVLLLRAGMIKNLVAGVYNYLPLGLKVLTKIEKVIREEMDNAGCIEILCSALQPKELWEESGRWSKYGPELMRLTDRHDREFCLGPTHEEIFTSMARDLIKSSKTLPINLYQIQTKYRDEVRPRFGLMRGREFIMKDAYSFDKDEKGLDVSYQNMYNAYSKVFDRLGIHYQAVLADTGNIGGNGSHQFMALSDIGESAIAYCDACGYAADVEKASIKLIDKEAAGELPLEKVETINKRTIEEISSYLNVDPNRVAKTVMYHDFVNDKIVAIIIRGDREVNEIKVCNAIVSNENYLELASEEDIKKVGSINGFCGPKGINCEVYIDDEIANMKNLVIGANELNYHYINANFGRDFNGTVCDLKNAQPGDLCPVCGKPLAFERGIEVGQIFKLQTKYSEAMKLTYVNEEGKNIPMVMGCYGIGVTRTLQAIVEQYHDEFGIKWPLIIAPYHAVLVPINYADEAQSTLAHKMYDALKSNGVEVVLDDRNSKPGFKFKDWELIGIPYIITCGRLASEEIVEFKDRQTMVKEELPFEEAIARIVSAVKNI